MLTETNNKMNGSGKTVSLSEGFKLKLETDSHASGLKWTLKKKKKNLRPSFLMPASWIMIPDCDFKWYFAF